MPMLCQELIISGMGIGTAVACCPIVQDKLAAFMDPANFSLPDLLRILVHEQLSEAEWHPERVADVLSILVATGPPWLPRQDRPTAPQQVAAAAVATLAAVSRHATANRSLAPVRHKPSQCSLSFCSCANVCIATWSCPLRLRQAMSPIVTCSSALIHGNCTCDHSAVREPCAGLHRR
jgi:hypothetical protein